MIDGRNLVTITGGITRLEVINDKILKFGLAVDYAGSEKDSDNSSGYFDVTYFLNNSDNARNAKFVRDQVEADNLKKGSQVQVVGRLVQERWASEESKNQKVVIVAESVNYSGSRSGANTSSASASGSPAQADLPTDF